jgi:uncharacterized membrane protein
VGAAAGAGAGLLATIAAASTGLLGCCGGSAFAGGVFALAGLGSASAAALSKASPLVQVGLILVFVALYARLRHRRAEVELAEWVDRSETISESGRKLDKRLSA